MSWWQLCQNPAVFQDAKMPEFYKLWKPCNAAPGNLGSPIPTSALQSNLCLFSFLCASVTKEGKGF